jgi:phage-related minor tail protein
MCRQFTPSVDEELANKILALTAAVKDVTKDVSDLRKQPPMVQKP